MKIVNTYYKIFLVIFSLGLVTACNHDDFYDEPANFVTFEYAPGGKVIGVPVDGSASYEATVYTANETGTDRTFNIVTGGTIGAGAVDVPATVTIPAGENSATVMVNASDIGLGVSGKTLTLSLEDGADYSVGSPISFSVVRSCPGSALTIDIAFDGYADETTWRLIDSDGNVVVETTGYSRGQAAASRSLCVSPGTYTFEIEDSYGDGLTYPNLGSVTISYAGTVLTTFDGNFGAGTSVEISF